MEEFKIGDNAYYIDDGFRIVMFQVSHPVVFDPTDEDFVYRPDGVGVLKKYCAKTLRDARLKAKELLMNYFYEKLDQINEREPTTFDDLEAWE